MTNSNRTASAVSLSKLHITLLRKLFETVKHEMGRRAIESPDKFLAAYERQEAELVRSLDHTRRVLALLRDEPTTAVDDRDPVN